MDEYFCAIIIIENTMVTKKQDHHKNLQDSISLRSNKWALTEVPTYRLNELDCQVIAQKRDKQGNPVEASGRLIAKKVSSIDSIPDECFTNPMVSIELPMLPEWLRQTIGACGKRVIIKKNILEKNRNNHPELNGCDCRKILLYALYKTNLYGHTQPISRPEYWIVIHTAIKNYVVVLEASNNKDDIEIVGWRYSGKRQLEKLRKQAVREDGQLLIQTPKEKGAAAGLSTLPPVVSNGKDSVTNSDTQEKELK